MREDEINKALLLRDYEHALSLHQQTVDLLPDKTAKDISLRLDREVYLLLRLDRRKEAMDKVAVFFDNLPPKMKQNKIGYEAATFLYILQCFSEPTYYKLGQKIGKMYEQVITRDSVMFESPDFEIAYSIILSTFIFSRLLDDDEQAAKDKLLLDTHLKTYQGRYRQYWKNVREKAQLWKADTTHISICYNEMQPTSPFLDEDGVVVLPLYAHIDAKLWDVSDKIAAGYPCPFQLKRNILNQFSKDSTIDKDNASQPPQKCSPVNTTDTSIVSKGNDIVLRPVVRVPADCKTLLEACKQVAAGGKIIVSPGTYRLDKPIVLSKPCSIVNEVKQREQVVIESKGVDTFVIETPQEQKTCDISFESITLKSVGKADKSKQRSPQTGYKIARNTPSEKNVPLFSPLYIIRGKVTLTDCVLFSENSIGCTVTDEDSELIAHSCTFQSISDCALDVCGYAKADLRDVTLIAKNIGVQISVEGHVALTRCNIEHVVSAIYVSTESRFIAQSCRFTNVEFGVLCCESSQGTITDCNFANPTRVGVMISGESRVTVERCNISTVSVGVMMYQKSQLTAKLLCCSDCDIGMVQHEANATLTSCDIHSNMIGIDLQEGAHLDATNCVVSANGRYPFNYNTEVILPNQPITIEQNEKYTQYDYDHCGAGISLKNSSCNLTRCKLQNNKLHGLIASSFCNIELNDCVVAENGIGLEMSRLSKGMIRGGRIHSNIVSGVRLLGGSSLDASNTTVENNQEGIVFQGKSHVSVTNVAVLNNCCNSKKTNRSSEHISRDWVQSPDSTVDKKTAERK